MASSSTSSMDSLVPVSREHAFLESFFQCLNKNLYEKAKDLCVSIILMPLNYVLL